jgi:hypothetical protein
MNKELVKYLMLVFMITVFIYVGLTITLTLYDELMGTNYAYWFNFIGWCSVPIVGIGVFIWYLKIRKNPVNGDR